MPDYFNKILIPLDLSINTDVAIHKGLELADAGSTIHLLYVHRYPLPGLTGIVKKCIDDTVDFPDCELIRSKLDQWKVSIKETRDDLDVHTWIVLEESVQNAIEKKAKQLAVDIIIIGKNSRHSWFPFLNTVNPNKLVKKTGIVVLTIRPGSIGKKHQTIVAPVTSETAMYKMEVISAICRKFRVKIHIVTFLNGLNDSTGFSASSLIKVYQELRPVDPHIEFALLHGHNKAKAIMEYADKIKADILLVQPKSETKIGWPDRHISDVLPARSKVQVWAV